MHDLGQALQVLAELYVDRDVVDLTGLQGPYDFKLSWVGRQTIDQGGPHAARRAGKATRP